MDTEKYKVLHYVISKEGKWSPRPIAPEPSGNPGDRCRVPGVCMVLSAKTERCRVCSNWPICLTLGAGVLASSISMDKEMMKRVARERGLPVVDYAGAAIPEARRSGSHMRALRISGFRETREPGIVGGHFEGAKLRSQLKAALELGGRL